MTLTDFLLSRITEDEVATVGHLDVYVQRERAECEAKRQIVENAERNRTDLMRRCDLYSWEARVLAAVYADHPDYRQEWKP